MAKRLNVLVGAVLDGSVTKDLNKELKALEKNLESLSIRASFDGDFQAVVEAIQKAVSSIDLSLLNNGLDSTRTALATTSKEIENLGKVTEKSNKVVTDLHGNLKTVERTVEGMDGKEVKVKFVAQEDGSFGGNLTYTDTTGQKAKQDRKKAQQEEERAWQKYYSNSLKAQNQYNDAIAAEIADRAESEIKIRQTAEQNAFDEQQRIERDRQNLLKQTYELYTNSEEKVKALSDTYGDMKDVDGKKFFKKAEADGYTKSLDNVAQRLVDNEYNSEELLKINKELADFNAGLDTRKTKLDDDIKANEIQKQHNAEVKEAVSLQKQLQSVVGANGSAWKQLEQLKQAYPQADFSDLEKQLKSYNGTQMTYSRLLKDSTRETQWYVDAQDELATKLKEVNAIESGMANIDFKALGQKNASQIIAEERRQAALHETKELAEETGVKLKQLYEKGSGLDQSVFGKNEVKHLQFFEAELDDILKVLNDDKSSLEDVLNAAKRLANLKIDTKNFDLNLDKGQSEYLDKVKEMEAAEERHAAASEKLEEKRQKALLNTAETAREVEIALRNIYTKSASYDNDVYGYDQDKQLQSFEAELADVYNILKKDNVQLYELIEAANRLANLKIDADKFALELDNSQKNIWQAQEKASEDARKAQIKANEDYVKFWEKTSADDRANKNKQERQIRQTYESIKNTISEIANIDAKVFTEKDTAEVEEIKKELKSVLEFLKKENVETYELINATEKLNALQKQSSDYHKKFSGLSGLQDRIDTVNAQTDREVKTLRAQYGEAFDEDKFRQVRNITAEIAKIIKEQGYNAEAVNKAFRKINSATADFKTDLRVSKKEIKEIEEQARVLNSSLGRFIQFYGFGQIFGALKQAGRDVFEQITQVNTSMTELRKVTDLTDKAYENFLDDASKNSRKLGVTMTDYIDSVTNFARMDVGGFEAAKEVAEVANIFQQVSENLTADQASEYLISNMKAWGYQAHETIEIVDVLNNLDRGSRLETSGQTLSFYRKTSRDGRPIPRIRLFYVMCA